MKRASVRSLDDDVTPDERLAKSIRDISMSPVEVVAKSKYALLMRALIS